MGLVGCAHGLEHIFDPAASQQLATHDLDQLTDAALTQDLLALRQVLDRLEGQRLGGLAVVDAGADQGQDAASTASWLRNRLRMGSVPPTAASGPPGRWSLVPSPETAQALWAGERSPADARWSPTAPTSWLST